jgi:lipopolysaccharide/colanic/teichoic acid biosynthesis glycosyltransferase
MVKRILDIGISLLAIIVLFPFLFIIIIIAYFKLGTPIFFVQERPGLNEKIFKMIKFRSMCNSTDKNGELLLDSDRLTNFGKMLRRTSLDELPQLVNVLKGQMSIVGPRPLLVEYLPLYDENQRKRHNVRPGITGWAQINGRNTISWKEKFELDLWYVENKSFILDMKIIFITIIKVFNRTGINYNDNITIEKFTGLN